MQILLARRYNISESNLRLLQPIEKMTPYKSRSEMPIKVENTGKPINVTNIETPINGWRGQSFLPGRKT